MEDQKTALEIYKLNAKAQMDCVKQSFIQKSRENALDTAKYMGLKYSREYIQPRVTPIIEDENKEREFDLLVEAEKIYQWLIKVAQ